VCVGVYIYICIEYEKYFLSNCNEKMKGYYMRENIFYEIVISNNGINLNNIPNSFRVCWDWEVNLRE